MRPSFHFFPVHLFLLWSLGFAVSCSGGGSLQAKQKAAKGSDPTPPPAGSQGEQNEDDPASQEPFANFRSSIGFDRTFVDFGDLARGEANQQEVSLSNGSSEPVVLTDMPTVLAGFSLVSTSCQAGPLPAGATCSFVVRFSAEDVGRFTSQLALGYTRSGVAAKQLVLAQLFAAVREVRSDGSNLSTVPGGGLATGGNPAQGPGDGPSGSGVETERNPPEEAVPVLSLVAPTSGQRVRGPQVTVSGGCTPGLALSVGENGGVSHALPCPTAGSFEQLVDLSEGDGIKILTASLRNGAGALVIESVVVVKDTTVFTAPVDPSALEATAAQTSLSLSWLPPAEVPAAYRVALVEGSTPPAECPASAAETSAESFVFRNLSAATVYSFRVCSVNGDEPPLVSTGVTLTASTRHNPPSDPSALVLTPDDHSVEVSWNAGAGAAGYTIAFQAGSVPVSCAQGVVVSSELVSGTSHRLSGLDADQLYGVRVCAVNADMPAAVSAGVSALVSTLEEAPAPVIFTSGGSPGSSQFMTDDPTPTWSWGSFTGAIHEVTFEGVSFETVATQFTPAAPLARGKHSLSVRARSGGSGWSAAQAQTADVRGRAPVVTGGDASVAVSGGVRPTAYRKPVWRWRSNESEGSGAYRFTISADDLTGTDLVGSPESSEQHWRSVESLEPGLHTVYVQEKLTDGTWSAVGGFTLEVRAFSHAMRGHPDPVGRFAGSSQTQTATAPWFSSANAENSARSGCGGRSPDLALDTALCSRQRYSPTLTVTIPAVPHEHYLLGLYLWEPWFSSSGQRIADISVNGSVVFPAYDISALQTDLERLIVPVQAGADGRITVSMSATVNQANISAVELFTADPPAYGVNLGGPGLPGRYHPGTQASPAGLDASAVQRTGLSNASLAGATAPAPVAAYADVLDGAWRLTLNPVEPASLHNLRFHFRAGTVTSCSLKVNGATVLSGINPLSAVEADQVFAADVFRVIPNGSGQFEIETVDGSGSTCAGLAAVELSLSLPGDGVSLQPPTLFADDLVNPDGESYELGSTVTFEQSGYLTAVRMFFLNAVGQRDVSIWNSTGNLALGPLGIQASAPRSWATAALPAPIRALAGETYTVSVSVQQDDGYPYFAGFPYGRHMFPLFRYPRTSGASPTAAVFAENPGEFPTQTAGVQSYGVDFIFIAD